MTLPLPFFSKTAMLLHATAAQLSFSPGMFGCRTKSLADLSWSNKNPKMKGFRSCHCSHRTKLAVGREKNKAMDGGKRNEKKGRNSSVASTLIWQFLRPTYFLTFLQLGGSMRHIFLEKPPACLNDSKFGFCHSRWPTHLFCPENTIWIRNQSESWYNWLARQELSKIHEKQRKTQNRAPGMEPIHQLENVQAFFLMSP